MPKADLCCPKCKFDEVYRMERRGFLQIAFFPLFGYFPWECAKCRKTYLLKGRHEQDSQAVAPGTV